MNTTHDDLPHPIPPIAYLRWKENYFMIVLDRKNDIYGMAHLSHEPIFDRARMSCNLQIKGKPFRYANQIPFPKDFEYNPNLGDGTLKFTIVKSHEEFKLALKQPDWSFDITFLKHTPTYDYSAAPFAAPEMMSFREAMTLNTNLHYNHVQQGMYTKGTVTAGGTTYNIDDMGYRDHSWSLRSDNVVAEHTWCGLNFKKRVFGVMTLETLVRPGLWAKEGYVSDEDGTRALREIEATRVDISKDGYPKKLVHKLKDVYGKTYNLESDIEHRLAEVPLDVEGAHAVGKYVIAETFCKTVDTATGEEGVSLIELGRHSTRGGIGGQ